MREIDEIIVHCTATPEGRDVARSEIDEWHKARGWSGIGYHRVIGLNGQRFAGRELSKVGAHCASRNSRTIGVVYVGGVEVDGRTPKDTRTAAQKASLINELTELRDRFGIQKVSGHNEYAAKACPCFNASEEYDHLFPEGGFMQTEEDLTLERGDIGPMVRNWRQDLATYRRMIKHPYPIPIEGPFDHTLELVTIWFQKQRGIFADGKVGPQTQDEMDRALNGKPPYQALATTEPDLDEVRRHLNAAQAALGSA
ncbi:N-acetylmuramoyl-L-alanine amidase [Roseibium sp.]|uniref:peptidoglycan recognition protein family protein n=1 Tax=Roseibium sp. TaxID=1936156 RepID=UPI003B51AA37